MTLDQRLPSCFQPGRIQIRDCDFAIGMTGNASISKHISTPKKIGSLNVSEWKWLVTRLGLRNQRCQFRITAQVLKHIFFPGTQCHLTLLRHDSFGRPKADLASFLPKPHTHALKFGNKIRDVHTMPSSIPDSSSGRCCNMIAAKSRTVGAANSWRNDI